MATFLLTHGAFQGAWTWEGVAGLLRRAGHEVHVPTLTGSGERSHLLREGVGRAVWLEDLRAEFYFKDLRDVILVGHSFSGLLAGETAARLEHLVARLVLVDAVIPQVGQSFLNLAGPEFGGLLRRQLQDGWLVRPWSLEMFGLFCETDKRWFQPRLTPFPLSGFTEPWLDRPLPDTLPVTYLRCVRNANPFIAGMSVQARARDWGYVEIDAHHCPMVTAAPELARTLSAVAEDLPARQTGNDRVGAAGTAPAARRATAEAPARSAEDGLS